MPHGIVRLTLVMLVLAVLTGCGQPQRTAVDYTPPADFKADDPRKIQVGMEVEHQKFGVGKVVSMEGDENNRIATMFFSGIGQKRIMLKYAKVRIHNKMD